MLVSNVGAGDTHALSRFKNKQTNKQKILDLNDDLFLHTHTHTHTHTHI